MKKVYRATKPFRHAVCPSEQVIALTVRFYNYLKFLFFSVYVN
jgi:hypothetical protein